MGTDVVGKLGGREVGSPIVLSDRGVSAEILFEFLINPLCLTIRLRVISRGEGLIYIQKGTKVTSECGGELGTVIRYEFTGKTETFPDVITIEGSCAVSRDGGVTGSKDGSFGNIMINEDSDGIKTIRLGEFCDEIHGDGGKRGGIGERGNRVKRNRWTIGEILGCLTNSATVNVVKGEAADTRPIKLAFDKIPGLQTTGMTDGGSVMERVDDGLTDVKISRYI